MPLLPSTDTPNPMQPNARFPQLRSPPGDPPDSALDVMAAAERTSNIVGQAYERFANFPKPDAPPQTGFNPIDHIPDGYLHDYGHRFLDAENPEQVQWIKQRIDSERGDQQILTRAGWGGTAASFAAGQTDPLTLASMALVPTSAPTRIGNAIRWAITNAATTGAQELASQSLSETRTAKESLLNIGGGAVLGGLLGSLARRVPLGTFNKMGADIGEELRTPGSTSALGPEQRSIADPQNLEGAREGPVVVGAAPSHEAVGEYEQLPAPTLEQRLAKEPELRSELEKMKGETGWAEIGGRMIRKSEDVNSPDYATVVGRTSWLPKYEWWPNRPKGLTEEQVKGAVDKALAGEKLGKREQAMVDFMSEVADERRRSAEFTPFPEDLPEHARGEVDARDETAMVARASEKDEAHIERLAVQYPERGEFLSKVREFLREDDNARAAGRGQEGAGETPGFEDAYAEYDREQAARPKESEAPLSPEAKAAENHSLPGEPAYVNPNEGSTAGAAAVEDETEGLTTARGAQTLTKIVGRVTPGGRLMTQPSIAARKLTLQLANITGTLEQNYKGVANPNPIERILWGYDGLHSQGMALRREQFKAYLARVQQEGGDPLSRREFMDQVSYAMRRGDQSAIPEVAKAAAVTRAKIFQPLYDRALKLGLVAPEAKLHADSYLTRQYDTVKIRGDMKKWIDLLREGFIEQGVDSAEATDIAYAATRNILGSERGTMDWHALDNIVPQSGQMKERTLALPDHLLEPYLNNDIDHLSHSYLRSMAPEVELTERFGSRDLKDQLDDVTDEYTRMMERARSVGDSEAVAKLIKQRDRTIRDLGAIRDRLYGLYGAPKDPGAWWIRAGRLARQINAGRLLGAATLSHLPDFANITLRYGAPNTFAAMAKLATSLDAMKLSYAQAKRMGAALDMTMNMTASLLGDYGTHSRFAEQRIANRLTRTFTIVTGETPLITLTQAMTSALAQDELIRSAERVASGTALSSNLAAKMAAAGIDESMLKRIADQRAKFGQDINGLKFAMSEKWADQKAAQAFESAVIREAHGVTLRPGVADTPLFMSNEIGKVVLQFKSFAFAANRVVGTPLAQGIAHGDVRAAASLLALTSMGTLSYALKQKAAGQPIETNKARLAGEVLDKSNLLGWTGEVIFPALWLAGFKNMSRFSDRDLLESAAGPTAGTALDLLERQYPGRFGLSKLASEVDEENKDLPFRRSDLHFLRRMLPAQNLWYARRGVNALEDMVGDAFGLPGKSNEQRDLMAAVQ